MKKKQDFERPNLISNYRSENGEFKINDMCIVWLSDASAVKSCRRRKLKLINELALVIQLDAYDVDDLLKRYAESDGQWVSLFLDWTGVLVVLALAEDVVDKSLFVRAALDFCTTTAVGIISIRILPAAA